MRNRLFWRLFAAFTATILLTVAVSAFAMVAMVRAERQDALESELTVQARDIALLLRQQDAQNYGFFGREPYLGAAVKQKIVSVREEYNCTVWLAYANGVAYAVESDTVSAEQLRSDAMLEQLYRVLSGAEIHVRGLLDPETASTVTIGVPWLSSAGRVQGAVMLHISVADLKVDYSDTIRNALISGALSLALGTFLSLIIASSQSKPLRRITTAVTQFAQGNLASRIPVQGKGEIAALAQSFNTMAEDLSRLEESRRSFVASVSHELRSPLTCIRGYIEGMQDGTIPPEEQGPYLEIVLQETNRLTALVNDLLDLSRIESGKVALKPEVFDINELARLSVIKFERRIEEKNLNVEVHLREEPLLVRADRDRIAQVLTNLIDNAIKFLPEGGLLALSAREAGRECLVSVRDNGPGIAQEDLPYIFDRFYKADKAHTSGMGTGLGLSIVKKILEQHGQDIRVSSSKGGGAEFTFTLEAAQAPEKRKEESPNESL